MHKAGCCCDSACASSRIGGRHS